MQASLARPRFPQARLCRQALVESGPIPAIHGVVRWRRKDLAHWIFEEFRISVDETTVGRELRARLPANTAIEIWWQDEARVGQKTMLTRRWARRGSRPTALRDQRTKSAYIFGAICPARGVGAGLVLPRCNTQAMQWHLDEISALVTPGAHAVLIIDRAGWHTTGRLEIPSNITLMFLPPRAPELNPVENIWQFMRDNWLSNRIFKTYDDIVALCCEAWNRLIDQPWKIMSIGRRKWAHVSISSDYCA